MDWLAGLVADTWAWLKVEGNARGLGAIATGLGIAGTLGWWLVFYWLPKRKEQAAPPQVSATGTSGPAIAVGGPETLTIGDIDAPRIAHSEGVGLIHTGRGAVQTGPISVTNINGVSPDDHAKLAAELGVTLTLVEVFLQIAIDRKIPREEWPRVLPEIAQEFKQLKAGESQPASVDPRLEALRKQAAEAADAGDFERTKRLWAEVKEGDLAAGRQHQEVSEARMLSAALAAAQVARVEAIELHYAAAAAAYSEAADLVPAGHDESKVEFLFRTGTQALHAADFATAEQYLRRALVMGEEALGPEHSNVGSILNSLAVLYERQGRYADAEPLCRRALAIGEKAQGPEDPILGAILNTLGTLHSARGHYADAEPLFQQALRIFEHGLGPEHPDVGVPLNNLAIVYRALGRPAEAEPLYQRDLAIGEKALGPEHPSVATTLDNLAGLYKEQGRHADAEPLFRRALAIREKALGPGHPDVGATLCNLAGLLAEQGRYADAEPLSFRALATLEQALGLEHPDVAVSLNNLAFLYRKQEHYADAEPLYRRAVSILEKALGAEHPNTKTTAYNFAILLRKQGLDDDAIAERLAAARNPER